MNDIEPQKDSTRWQTCPACREKDFTDFHTCRYCQTPYSGRTALGYAFPGTEPLYGSATDRFYSYLVDTAIFFVLFYFVPLFKQPLYVPLFVALNWLYQAVLISQLGGTLGQFALGLRVTTTEGEPVGFLRATLRYFASFLSLLCGGLGNLMALGGTKRQTLHDIISGCVLIEDNGQRGERTRGAHSSIFSLLVFLFLAGGIAYWQYAKIGSQNASSSRQIIGSRFYLTSKAYGAGDLDALYLYAGWRKKVNTGFYNKLRLPVDPYRDAASDPIYRDLINSRRLQRLYGDISPSTLQVHDAGVQIVDLITGNNPSGAPVYRVSVLNGQQKGQQYWLLQTEINFAYKFDAKRDAL